MHIHEALGIDRATLVALVRAPMVAAGSALATAGSVARYLAREQWYYTVETCTAHSDGNELVASDNLSQWIAPSHEISTHIHEFTSLSCELVACFFWIPSYCVYYALFGPCIALVWAWSEFRYYAFGDDNADNDIIALDLRLLAPAVFLYGILCYLYVAWKIKVQWVAQLM